MPAKEATARIKFNKRLEISGWHFIDDENGFANLGKHEIYTPAKTYLPITVRGLAENIPSETTKGAANE